MNEALLWVVLAVTAITAVLSVVLLLRGTRASESAGREVRDELRLSREEARSAGRELREEVAGGLKSTNEVLSQTLESLGKLQQAQLAGMTKQLQELSESNQAALERVRTTFDSRVKELQEGNEKKLEEMRRTVDEKLHDTLEKRLGESFKLVSERLEAVHQGLGDMQHLATGVGDLKRVLTNVKARGTWAEVQLGALLEQILTPEQFGKNVRVKPDSLESVEYAVRLPGPKEDPASCVWLPIDSKFPQEDYHRLQEAAERADPEATQAAMDSLARTIRAAARDIHDKYLSPPGTTDFGIMFLATEGLYAEVLRQPGVVEELQQRYRVVVAGPTTLAAILSSLRMGFQTLAIEQRAVEVWRVLGAIKTEFGKFGELLTKVKQQIDLASRTIDKTGVRTRAIERKLREVEKLPEPEALEIFALPAAGQEEDGEDLALKESPAETT
jgi:DNA recombination protein RmuC